MMQHKQAKEYTQVIVDFGIICEDRNSWRERAETAEIKLRGDIIDE